MRITVRYFAGARAAAGADTEELVLPAEASVQDALATLRARRSAELIRVLDAASYLLDGIAVRDRSIALREGAELDVLPPFAGG